MTKIDYIYIYPKNWDGNISNMIYQEVLRGDTYKILENNIINKKISTEELELLNTIKYN